MYNQELYQCLKTHHQSLDESSETRLSKLHEVYNSILQHDTSLFSPVCIFPQKCLFPRIIISWIKQMIPSVMSPRSNWEANKEEVHHRLTHPPPRIILMPSFTLHICS